MAGTIQQITVDDSLASGYVAGDHGSLNQSGNTTSIFNIAVAFDPSSIAAAQIESGTLWFNLTGGGSGYIVDAGPVPLTGTLSGTGLAIGIVTVSGGGGGGGGTSGGNFVFGG